MTEPKPGRLIDGEAFRDAIHIALAPVYAQCDLKPGQPVNEVGNYSANPVGIVDPFLLDDIKPGQRFYIFLYPGTVTSLRHVWTHPAFKAKLPI